MFLKFKHAFGHQVFVKLQNGHHQKLQKQKMLERVWRKGNPPALLVGM